MRPSSGASAFAPHKTASNKGEIDLFMLARLVWQGKITVLAAAILAAGLGIYYAFAVATPYYAASAVVALESRQEQVVDLESVMSGLGGDQITINTEVEVLRSRGLLEKLARKLDLTDDPEFNAALRDRPLPGRILRTLTGIGDPPASEQAVFDEVVDTLLTKVSITNLRQSYVFRITALTEDSEKSARIANTLAELYVRDQLEIKFEATEQATSWLTDRVGQLQIALEEAEAAVKAFNAETELVSPEALALLNRNIKDLRDRLLAAQVTEAAAQSRVLALQEARKSRDVATLAELADDRALAQIYTQISAKPASGTLDAHFGRALNRAKLDQARAASQISTLTETIENQRAQIERQSADLVALQQLQREAEASRLIYEYFLGRLKETSVQQGIHQADSRILSHAAVPQIPSAPQKTLIIAITFVLGALAGTGTVVGREFSKTTFRAAEELEAQTGYAVLGQIPIIPSGDRKTALGYLVEKPASAAAEAVRNLRTSILLSELDDPPQVIMSTSSVPGEGKTTQSLALAQNLSGLGKKVLLIEGDIRRRVFSDYFDIPSKRGFISVLLGDQSMDDTVFRETSLGIDILPGETSATNAADLFSSDRFSAFLSALRANYDYIIIDTPPVLAVPDARVIGQSVDAILYTVKWDSTTHRQVHEGLKSFETVNLEVAGLVLSQIDAKGMKQYGYGDSHGAYSAYYDN
ncbi:MAG: polysaccharide biosynthesis tyrosine autokinase [Pseudomonadota bacterium]